MENIISDVISALNGLAAQGATGSEQASASNGSSGSQYTPTRSAEAAIATRTFNSLSPLPLLSAGEVVEQGWRRVGAPGTRTPSSTSPELLPLDAGRCGAYASRMPSPPLHAIAAAHSMQAARRPLKRHASLNAAAMVAHPPGMPRPPRAVLDLSAPPASGWAAGCALGAQGDQMHSHATGLRKRSACNDADGDAYSASLPSGSVPASGSALSSGMAAGSAAALRAALPAAMVLERAGSMPGGLAFPPTGPLTPPAQQQPGSHQYELLAGHARFSSHQHSGRPDCMCTACVCQEAEQICRRLRAQCGPAAATGDLSPAQLGRAQRAPPPPLTLLRKGRGRARGGQGAAAAMEELACGPSLPSSAQPLRPLGMQQHPGGMAAAAGHSLALPAMQNGPMHNEALCQFVQSEHMANLQHVARLMSMAGQQQQRQQALPPRYAPLALHATCSVLFERGAHMPASCAPPQQAAATLAAGSGGGGWTGVGVPAAPWAPNAGGMPAAPWAPNAHSMPAAPWAPNADGMPAAPWAPNDFGMPTAAAPVQGMPLLHSTYSAPMAVPPQQQPLPRWPSAASEVEEFFVDALMAPDEQLPSNWADGLLSGSLPRPPGGLAAGQGAQDGAPFPAPQLAGCEDDLFHTYDDPVLGPLFMPFQ